MSEMLNAATQYAELGYAVFPCISGDKKPLAEHGCRDATLDIERITEWWTTWPGANVAIATDGLVVVDVDGDRNDWLADEPERLLELAQAPLALTPSGGRHYIFRAPSGNRYRGSAGRLAPHVDVRADGNYIVVAPSVLWGGKRYRWINALDVPVESLSEPPVWLLAALDALQAPPTVSRDSASGNPIPSGQRNSTLTRMAGYMRRGGASQAEIAACLQRANQDRCRPPLDGDEVDQIAASVTRYEPNAITTALVEDHYTQDFQAGTASAPASPIVLPEHLLVVPGFIQEVMAYNLETAVRPQPVLALASALCLQAILASRRVCDERGNRTNLYVIGVADSGRGKDHGRKVNRSILFHAGLDSLEGCEDIASDAGLVAALEASPATLFQIDEFGRFLRTIGDPKKAPHLFNVISTLMKLYSSADTIFRGKAYADARRNKIIDQPCVSLYGTTVPEHFFQSLTAEGLADGFVARLLVFETHDMPERQRRALAKPPEALVAAARWWGELKAGGDLRGEHPQPLIVPASADALRVFDALSREVDVELSTPANDGRSLWARAEEKACRLALVYACSANRNQLLIDEPAASWACELVTLLTRRLLQLAEQWVADGSFDARQKRVLRIVHAAGGKISRNELCRKTQSLSVRERAEVMDNLRATGQIVEFVETPPSGRSRTVYALASVPSVDSSSIDA
jgi:hypothetical protein